jgi:hypothetical protein
MALAWKAGWVQALAGSNPASSASSQHRKRRQGNDPLSGARLRCVCRRAHVLPCWAVAGVLVPTVWLAAVPIARPSAAALHAQQPRRLVDVIPFETEASPGGGRGQALQTTRRPNTCVRPTCAAEGRAFINSDCRASRRAGPATEPPRQLASGSSRRAGGRCCWCMT